MPFCHILAIALLKNAAIDLGRLFLGFLLLKLPFLLLLDGSYFLKHFVLVSLFQLIFESIDIRFEHLSKEIISLGC